MDFIVELGGSLILVAVAVVVAVLLTEMINAILSKDKHWFSLLLLVLGIMLAEAAVYSWLPGRFGYKVEMLEGAFSLDDGAVISNLGGIFLAQGCAFAFTLAKLIWSGIRKKGFSWKVFLLELLLMALFFAGAAALFQNDQMLALTKDESVRTPLLLGFGFGGALLILLGVSGLRTKKK